MLWVLQWASYKPFSKMLVCRWSIYKRKEKCSTEHAKVLDASNRNFVGPCFASSIWSFLVESKLLFLQLLVAFFLCF